MSATHDQCVVRDGGLDYCAHFGETMGKYFLDLFKVQSDQSWILYGVLFDVVFYAIFMLLAYYVLEHKRIETPEHAHVVVGLSGDHCSATGSYESMATPRSADAAIAIPVAPRSRFQSRRVRTAASCP